MNRAMQEKLLDGLIDLFSGMSDGDEDDVNPNSPHDGNDDGDDGAKLDIISVGAGKPQVASADDDEEELNGKLGGALGKLKLGV